MGTESRHVEPVVRVVPGVVDTIGLAFGLLNRRPYLIWVIVLVDVLLWSGINLGASQWSGERVLPEFLTSEIEQPEPFGVVAWFMPTLLDTLAVRSAEAGTIFSVDADVAGLSGSLLLAGSVIVAVILTLLNLIVMTRLVRREPVELGDVVYRPFVTAVQMFGAAALAVLLIAFLMLPFIIVSLGLETIGIQSRALIVWSAILLGGWLGTFFLFTGPGLAGGESSVASAMQRSYQVVQRNILGLLGLLLIILLIRLGVPFALSPFTESNWSIPFAVVVNAYVAAGLTASFVLFFQIRAQLLEPDATIGSTSR